MSLDFSLGLTTADCKQFLQFAKNAYAEEEDRKHQEDMKRSEKVRADIARRFRECFGRIPDGAVWRDTALVVDSLVFEIPQGDSFGYGTTLYVFAVCGNNPEHRIRASLIAVRYYLDLGMILAELGDPPYLCALCREQ